MSGVGTEKPALIPEDQDVFLRTALTADVVLKDQLNAMRMKLNLGAELLAVDEALQTGTNDYTILSHLLLLSLNGQYDLQQQTVQVEYLRNEQRLIIPQALGMSVTANENGRARRQVDLYNRYWRATTMTYGAIRDMIEPVYNQQAIRASVDGIPLPALPRNEIHKLWRTPNWAVDLEVGEQPDFIMGAFSAALQFNCDIRDVAMLNEPDMHTSDTAWQTAKEVLPDRLKCKFKPYTMQCIAALNYASVGNFAVTAFARAYGLGMGLLPSPDSLTQREWKFVVRQPPPEAQKAVNAFQAGFQRPMGSICANILSLFGLFHLAKDHTYKTGDADMDRISRSYVQTLRTCLSPEEQTSLETKIESVVRTGPHPFGLAQTYWLAQVMGNLSLLTAPLAVRLDVTPPPVQRLMIALAAAREWANLPAGRAIDKLFTEAYVLMKEEVAKINACAPAYSSLHRLYGIAAKRVVDDDVSRHVEAMMPTVHGYIAVTHVDQAGNKDGLGYALSLANVLRDSKGLSQMWANSWTQYLNTVDQMGLIDFVESMRPSVMAAMAASTPTAPPR